MVMGDVFRRNKFRADKARDESRAPEPGFRDLSRNQLSAKFISQTPSSDLTK